jgi:hypothetical protein
MAKRGSADMGQSSSNSQIIGMVHWKPANVSNSREKQVKMRRWEDKDS